MRPLWKDVLLALWLGMLVPGIVLNGFAVFDRLREPETPVIIRTEEQEKTCITILDPNGASTEMELQAYLTGVLLAEMPASFHEEALKAQAVAAGTYAWKAHITGGKHGNGSVCMDPGCCQDYITEEAYLSGGGTRESLEKVRCAVESVEHYVLVYDGELIEATYFSSAGGSTESAVAVWGADFPYLQAVSSPEQVRTDTVSYTWSELLELLHISSPQAPPEWFQNVVYTPGQGIASMEICGKTYTGVQLRRLLNLNSTAFEIAVNEDHVTVTTRGYGHRVGMSQYGANAMAQQGNTWQQILQHYYPGTTICPISP